MAQCSCNHIPSSHPFPTQATIKAKIFVHLLYSTLIYRKEEGIQGLQSGWKKGKRENFSEHLSQIHCGWPNLGMFHSH